MSKEAAGKDGGGTEPANVFQTTTERVSFFRGSQTTANTLHVNKEQTLVAKLKFNTEKFSLFFFLNNERRLENEKFDPRDYRNK